MKILFLDMDNTVRRTKSGATFINDPYDQELIPGVEEAIARYQDWIIIGITNQGGVKAGFKTLENCIQEQIITLKLIPEMQRIYFCPDDGRTCWLVHNENSYGKIEADGRYAYLRGKNFRKPSPGMIDAAFANRNQNYRKYEFLFVGDRPEDQQCAANANIPFMWAEDWRNGK